MRVTTEVKAATRDRILVAAAEQLTLGTWESTTTRDIAAAAGIANGTLFNYFPTREAIVAALIEVTTPNATKQYRRHRTGHETLDEELFSFEWTALKSLRAYRSFLAPALEAVFSPLASPARQDPGAAIRQTHLESVARILSDHGIPQPLPAVLLQLYWTLHLGVLAYWAADTSPHQEDSLALLDHSVKLFVASLSGGAGGTIYERGSE